MDLRKIFYLPTMASSHGQEIDKLIYIVHFLMLLLLVGWGTYFLFTLLRFNKLANPKANYHGVKSHVSSIIEIAIVVLEAILLIGFSIPFWAKQVNALPNRGDELMEVRAVAEQFAWNIHYPGTDGLFGSTGLKYFDKQSNPLGINPDDPNGKDDFVLVNQLHVPIGKTVLVHLSSKDVIHGFFLPEMRVKQDVIPGMNIPVSFTPTKTNRLSQSVFEAITNKTDELWQHLISIEYLTPDGYLSDQFKLILTSDKMSKLDPKYEKNQKEIFLALQKGNWQIACAQLCGLGHYYMRGFLKVHDQDGFDSWYADQSVSASGGDDDEQYDDFWN